MVEIQILDDHKMVVESISRMIDDSDMAAVTGRYFDIGSCRRGLAAGLPDILLCDIELPDGDGVEFCGELTHTYPGFKVVMLTSYREFNIARHALHNGALGYVLKNAGANEIFAAIETVARGKLFLCEEIDLLLEEKRGTDVIWLTNREREILKYIADGYTAREMADIIFRDVETVKTYRKNLFVKFKAKNMAELIKKGYEMKLIR